jgi:hypothetical protein
MGDAGEGLVDADSRIQERMEELERDRALARGRVTRAPEQIKARESLESLKLARTALEAQLAATPHERRRAQIAQAIEELDRRMAEVHALIA